ncbi:hypothetical protein ACF07M_12280 [Streptomyces globisporus]|uniref:hypothetical protein n=1 Tax=Streptomyces TaxID=1883 RepID=UPI0036FF7AFC
MDVELTLQTALLVRGEVALLDQLDPEQALPLPLLLRRARLDRGDAVLVAESDAYRSGDADGPQALGRVRGIRLRVAVDGASVGGA